MRYHSEDGADDNAVSEGDDDIVDASLCAEVENTAVHPLARQDGDGEDHEEMESRDMLVVGSILGQPGRYQRVLDHFPHPLLCDEGWTSRPCPQSHRLQLVRLNCNKEAFLIKSPIHHQNTNII